MSRKIGRNDPCPCGSGKKYKHCCGNATSVVEPEKKGHAGDPDLRLGNVQTAPAT